MNEGGGGKGEGEIRTFHNQMVHPTTRWDIPQLKNIRKTALSPILQLVSTYLVLTATTGPKLQPGTPHYNQEVLNYNWEDKLSKKLKNLRQGTPKENLVNPKEHQRKT